MNTDTRKEFAELLGKLNSLDEIKELDALVRNRWSYLRSVGNINARGNVQVGDSVRYLSTHFGSYVNGKVMKINRTTATVKVGENVLGMVYRVDLGMLEKVG